MTELTAMRNIGKELEKKLKSVGIGSAEELTQMGSKEAFRRLKARYPNVCLVHLYTLQGAVDQTEFNRLPDDVKRDLKRFSDSFK
ncbi:MAG: TfoX/Sxy family DNA transformation protein [Oscillospiraceae bacterium]|nr:TfoX/Sxy family DNA transformation protein [Oscillospiraceae bacterium]